MSPEQPQFETARKGYKTADVDGFVVRTNAIIDDLQSQMATIQRDLNDAYAEAAELREQLNTAGSELEKANQELDVTRGQEEALRMTLVSASRTKDEMLATAQLESENMVTQATTEANSILQAAREEAARLDEHIQHASLQIEQQMSRAEAEQRAQADAFAARIAVDHKERLAAISELETLYQTMAGRLETIMEEAHRGVSTGWSRLAAADPQTAAATAPDAEPSVPGDPVEPPDLADPASPPVPGPEGKLSALDKIAKLTEPVATPEAETTPEKDVPAITEPAFTDPSPQSPQVPKTAETVPAATPVTMAAEAEVAVPLPPVEIDGGSAAAPLLDEPATPFGVTEEVRSSPSIEPESEASETPVDDTRPGRDEAPAAAVEAEGEPEDGDDIVGETRRSFYDRRSGHLPRLGDAKQKDTSSWMASLRDKS